jgi:hypothetical protein
LFFNAEDAEVTQRPQKKAGEKEEKGEKTQKDRTVFSAVSA